MQDNNITPIVKLEYSISNDEDNMAFKEFQKKYVYRNNLFKTLVIFALIAIYTIQIMDHNKFQNYDWVILFAVLFFTIYIWIKPFLIRKNLLKALKDLENDVYEFELYPDYFSIKTVFTSVDKEVTNLSEFEENEEEYQEEPEEIEPISIYFDKQKLYIVEIKELIAIFVKNRTVYVLPKRVISNAQLEEIRKVFKEKLDNNFIIKKC